MNSNSEKEMFKNKEQITLLVAAIVTIITSLISAHVTIQLAKMNKVVDKIHIATNSGRTEMLRLNVTQTRRIAELTKDHQDIAIYERAMADLAAAETATSVLQKAEGEK
jgi:hypothetical protein